MSGTQQTTQPTIGVDVFKDLINQTINQMKTELKSDFGTKLSNLDSTMATKFNTLSNSTGTSINTLNTDISTKLDSITARLNNQDFKINNLGQRVETLEKHIATYPITYAEAAKSPPRPQQNIPKVSTTLSTTHSTSTSSMHNIMSSTPFSQTHQKNHDLTPEEIMFRSKHIVGIYPIRPQDIERNKSDTITKTLINTATEFLQHELGFRLEQIAEMQINKVAKTKKADGKTLYITFKNHTHAAQLFKRVATLKNHDLKISNYVPPHFYDRYHTLQSHCKTARENDDQLRTKIIYGTSDLILQEKKVGELRYSTVEINKYGELPPINTSLMWPTHELELPLTTPPKGRPQIKAQTPTPTPPILNTSQQQKRQLSSPETQPSTTDNTFKIQKRQKKSKKKVNADSSIDHLNTSDDNIPEVAKVYEGITGKRPYTKKNINHKLSSVTRNTL